MECGGAPWTRLAAALAAGGAPAPQPKPNPGSSQAECGCSPAELGPPPATHLGRAGHCSAHQRPQHQQQESACCAASHSCAKCGATEGKTQRNYHATKSTLSKACPMWPPRQRMLACAACSSLVYVRVLTAKSSGGRGCEANAHSTTLNTLASRCCTCWARKRRTAGASPAAIPAAISTREACPPLPPLPAPPATP